MCINYFFTLNFLIFFLKERHDNIKERLQTMMKFFSLNEQQLMHSSIDIFLLLIKETRKDANHHSFAFWARILIRINFSCCLFLSSFQSIHSTNIFSMMMFVNLVFVHRCDYTTRITCQKKEVKVMTTHQWLILVI